MESRAVWLTVVFGVLLVVGMMTWHAQIDDQVRPKSAQPNVVRIGMSNDVLSSLLIVAEQEHYFQDQHVVVDLVPFNTGRQSVAALTHETVDMSTSSNIPILIHALSHSNLVLLGTIARGDSMNQLIVRNHRRIKHPSDLRGRRLATLKNSASDYYTYLLLTHYNLLHDGVELHYMPEEQLADALRGGYIDGFVINGRLISVVQSLMGEKVSLLPVPNLTQLYFNLITRAPYLKDHSSKVQSVLIALLKASAFVRRHPERAKEDVIHFLGHDRQNEIDAMWLRYQIGLRFDDSLIQLLKSQLSWIRTQKSALGDKTDNDVLQVLIDMVPLAQANKHVK